MHGDKFAAIAGGAAAFAVPVDFTRPEYIRLPVHHPLNGVADVFIILYRHLAGVLFGIADIAEAVPASEFRVACRIKQLAQPAFLTLFGLAHILFNALEPLGQVSLHYFIYYAHHGLKCIQ